VGVEVEAAADEVVDDGAAWRRCDTLCVLLDEGGGAAPAAMDVRRLVEGVRCAVGAPAMGLLNKMSSWVCKAVRTCTAGPGGRRSGRFGGIVTVNVDVCICLYFFLFRFTLVWGGRCRYFLCGRGGHSRSDSPRGEEWEWGFTSLWKMKNQTKRENGVRNRDERVSAEKEKIQTEKSSCFMHQERKGS
jgi:hypothetical protein